MSYHYKTLAFILFLATLTFVFAYKAFSPLMPIEQFNRWRNSWYAVTLIAFLSSNFWIFIIVCGLYVLYIAKREENIFALYFVLLLAIPPIDKYIPGIGIDYLIPMNYPRLLSLILLLPLYLSLRSKPETVPFGKMGPDRMILAILILSFLLSLRGTTFTDALRYGVTTFADVFLPYYAASRAIKDMNQLKKVMIAFVIGCLVVAAIGIFEFRSSWLLYNTLDDSLGVPWALGSYLGRGGDIRAISSLGHPLILGYVTMIALGFYLFIAPSIKSKVIRLLGICFVSAGLFVTLSRGPWVGAVALIIAFLGTGPNIVKKFIIFALVALLTLPTLKIIPGGNKVIDILPFIGTSEQFNVEYREKLYEDSMKVIVKNPIFGVFDARNEPEMQELVQGEGIIDIVNTYLGVALGQGLIGLALFVGFFSLVLWTTYKAMKRYSKKSEEHMCGRSLISSLIGILVTIYTVGEIGVIPIIQWSLAGLMLSYSRIIKSFPNSDSESESPSMSLSDKQIFPTTLVRK
ncbi:MAG: O-antigen ligase family protein [Methylotenera sp.]